MEVECFFAPGLEFGQTSVLFAIAKQELELESGLVNPQHVVYRGSQVGRRQDRVMSFAVRRVPHQYDNAHPTFDTHAVQLSGIDPDSWPDLRAQRGDIDLVEAAQILPVNLATIDSRASPLAATTPLILAPGFVLRLLP